VKLCSAPHRLYARLYREGLVNRILDTAMRRILLCLPGRRWESRDPRAVRDAVLQEAERIGREGVHLPCGTG
jgi:hypothetical protein